MEVKRPLSFEPIAAEVPAIAHPSQQGRRDVAIPLCLFSIDCSGISNLALATQLVCLPLPAVYFRLVIPKHPIPMSEVIPELSLITESIGVVQHPLALPHTSLPASLIPQFYLATADEELVVVVHVLQHLTDQSLALLVYTAPQRDLLMGDGGYNM